MSRSQYGAVMRLLVIVLLSLLLAVVALAPASAAPTRRAAAQASLNSVGDRFVRAAIPVKGYVSGASAGKHKLVLQRWSPTAHKWFKRGTKFVRNGAYRFPAQYGWAPGRVKLRTVLYVDGRPRDVSNVLRVQVISRPVPTCLTDPSPTTCTKPAASTQSRQVSSAYCPLLVVNTSVETRNVDWIWSSAELRWVQDPGAWTTVPGSQSQRPAGAPDCVKIVPAVPEGAALPDLRIRNLTECGQGDSEATGGTCFLIIPSAPLYNDFPSLEGRKLLKFGVITLNVGAGPGEIIADRSAAEATDWTAYQSFYDTGGTLLGSMVAPNVQFYFAGDGHDHWHVRDFDDYELLDSTGAEVAVAEKHGYCMQDNTTYVPMQGSPGVPAAPVYLESTSCGKALPQALTIIHGLSRGWGDTYPTSLPDQAIDITGVADGEYTVQVHADAVGAVTESDETNNVAQVKVQIAGNTVTVVPGSSSGGLG